MLNLNEFVCYHGTTKDAALSIISDGFRLSSSNEDWLGNGVYFFINGISNPLEKAKEWARNSNVDDELCVIKAKVKLDESQLLDLRSTDGLKEYNEQKDHIIKEHYFDLLVRRDLKIKKRKDIRLDDCIIMRMLMNRMNYRCVIHNVYIKDKLQRELALESSYPNSTVLCVNELSLIESCDVIFI
ncbi:MULTISPECIES: hypothetical protein [Pantoea]|uniref:hypothetical protein n=1 Tax=Pantoea TaxID=53335 RepID=UPI000A9A5D82|nr:MULTISPECIES: hypothetical protein [Pantoea]MDI6634814.1 hypothetical protein [Pantoea dispersa]RVU75838.1 hypothetical protein EKH82_15480 [Pantoea dispersa]THD30790.1 hypothetical protein ERD80_19490 [Pantoea sp. R102]